MRGRPGTTATVHVDPVVERLAEVRQGLGMSQETLGGIVGRTHAMVSLLELGQRQPTLAFAREWASALGYDLVLVVSDVDILTVTQLPVTYCQPPDGVVCDLSDSRTDLTAQDARKHALENPGHVVYRDQLTQSRYILDPPKDDADERGPRIDHADGSR